MLQPWQVLASRPLLDRRPWLLVWEEDVQLPNGGRIMGYVRAVSRDFAEVFALREDGTVPLVQQYKHGLAGASYSLPAGYLDSEEEAPLVAAQRELREETGLVATGWQWLGSFVIDTNRGGTRAHFYLATGARLAGPQELDDTEAIEVSFHTPAEVRAMLLQGQIESLASAAIILLALDRLEPVQGPNGSERP